MNKTNDGGIGSEGGERRMVELEMRVMRGGQRQQDINGAMGGEINRKDIVDFGEWE